MAIVSNLQQPTVSFWQGPEDEVETMPTEGCLYHCTDTGNVYLGNNDHLVPVNRPVYYAESVTPSNTTTKIAIIDNTEAFTLIKGVVVAVRFKYRNSAQNPMLQLQYGTNDETVPAKYIKAYNDGTSYVPAGTDQHKSWRDGEIVTMVYDGSTWTMAGRDTEDCYDCLTFTLDKTSDLLTLPQEIGYINTLNNNNTWVTSTTGVHVFFPCKESYSRVTALANSSYGLRIAFLTSDTPAVNGATPLFVSGTSLLKTSKNESIDEVIPQGTKYIYVYLGVASSNYPYAPAEFKIRSVRGNADEATMSSWNGYGSCSTDPESNQSSPMVVTMSGYEIHTGGIVVVKFTHNVRGNSTMNINGQGAKPIYKDDSPITSGVILAGSTATFMYDGTNYNLVSVSNAQLVDNLVTSVDSGSSNTQYPSAKCLYNIVGNIETLLAEI